jgi:hypothetical protein
MRTDPRLTIVFALTSLPLHAQNPVREPVQPDDVAQLLATLAHDSLAGRDTGTPGAAAAARIIAQALRRAGVEPAGDSGYFQRVPVAWQLVTTQSGQTRRVMRLQPDFAARDTFPPQDRVEAVNVVGLLRGGDLALREEAVVVTAHYDHVGTTAGGRCASAGADSICNGADDDASGTVAVLEIARILARQSTPRRSVVFLLATGEERGLLGTNWYLAHPVVPLERTVANLNFEMIGRPDSLAGGPGRGWLTGFERSSMGAMLREAGVLLVPDPRPEFRFFERSDNIAFARRGIPAHTISSYNLHTDYHRPSDETRLADPSHMAAVIAEAARAVRLLADGPAPAWTPGDPYATRR